MVTISEPKKRQIVSKCNTEAVTISEPKKRQIVSQCNTEMVISEPKKASNCQSVQHKGGDDLGAKNASDHQYMQSAVTYTEV